MTKPDLPEYFIELLNSVQAKRPKTVIQHILKHGYITTEELQKEYGYEHPPRAARDVREAGIPLETFRVKDAEGRSIAAYRFGKLSEIREDKLGGRKLVSKEFKKKLEEINGSECHICLEAFEARYLQVDHRIPYEISGDDDFEDRDTSAYMLLCGSCNRAKSWSCEHCPNWEEKETTICQSCYWASPETYKHISLREERRVEIVWHGDEVECYERLCEKAAKNDMQIPDFVKMIIERHLKNKRYEKYK